MKAILEIMRKNGVEKTTDTYLEMMKAYAEMNDVAAIEKVNFSEKFARFFRFPSKIIFYVFARL